MHIKYRVCPAQGVLFLKQSGFSEYAIQLKFSAHLDADVGAASQQKMLVDLSDLTGSSSSSEEIYWQSKRLERRVEKLDDDDTEKRKIAVYVPTDLGYGLAKMYQGFAAANPRVEIELFDDLAVAADWLNLKGAPESFFSDGDWVELEY